jgi:S1-C subfamily serine protease
MIKGNRILTNAHVVSNARYIEVQKFLSSKKYIAKVKFISHTSDLAILTVENKEFYKGLVPLELGKLPELNSEVTTYGYPMGGVQLSVTRGVVSRIEMTTYAHSGVDQHLAIQTDAAINPGNSGGPVIQNGKVLGVAFQGLKQGDNLGYMIPSVVVKQFLDDTSNGKVDGFSEIAIQYAEFCQNPTFRKLIKLPDNMSGIVVTSLYPNMPAYKKLKPVDVITSINDHKITNDGFVFLDGRKINFVEIIERMQVGKNIHLDVWRDGNLKKITIKAETWKMIIPTINPYEVVPKYYIFGGLAFTTFSKGYVGAVGGWKNLPLVLKKLFLDANIDKKYSKIKEFPVLTQRLPNPINVNMEQYVGQVVESVNGKKIYSLRDLKNELVLSKQDLVEINFLGNDVPLIMSKKDAFKESEAILEKYHINSNERL